MSNDWGKRIDALEPRIRAGDWSALPEWNALRKEMGLPPKSQSDYDESWRKGEGRAPIENLWRFITGQGA